MARSTYIYVVIQPLGNECLPVAAFTVRREMVGWINRQPESVLPLLNFYRMRDNPVMPADHVVTKIELEYLLNA